MKQKVLVSRIAKARLLVLVCVLQLCELRVLCTVSGVGEDLELKELLFETNVLYVCNFGSCRAE